MIVVMPLGYGTMEFVRLGGARGTTTNCAMRTSRNFTEALLTEVMPQVESEYRITKEPQCAGDCGTLHGRLGISAHRPEQSRQVFLDRRFQLRRHSRRLRKRFSRARRQSQSATSSAVDRMRHRRSSDHDQPQPARMVEDQRREVIPKSKLPACTPGWYGEEISQSSRRCYFDNISNRCRSASSTATAHSPTPDPPTATCFTAAVRSSLSHANLRPSSARFSVLKNTTENNCR